MTWVVIYQTNTGLVFGWFCRAGSASQAEEQFFAEIANPTLVTIKCVAEFQSNIADALLEHYSNGGEQMSKKPGLIIDLKGTDGNIYMVTAKARQLVPSEQLNDFLNEILDAQLPGANKTYEDMLAIIDKYVNLEDSSGTYPDYAPHPDEEG